MSGTKGTQTDMTSKEHFTEHPERAGRQGLDWAGRMLTSHNHKQLIKQHLTKNFISITPRAHEWNKGDANRHRPASISPNTPRAGSQGLDWAKRMLTSNSSNSSHERTRATVWLPKTHARQHPLIRHREDHAVHLPDTINKDGEHYGSTPKSR